MEQFVVTLPNLKSLAIDKYPLFPGIDQTMTATQIDLSNPLTLIVGANGLGKTTLLNLIFRMLTGPTDLNTPSSSTKLGTGQLRSEPLRGSELRYFTARVGGEGRESLGRLIFTLDGETWSVSRNLADLSLQEWLIDQRPISFDSESEYQRRISDSAQVGSYTDWLLLLRYLVFSFEDRPPLLWDPTAQASVLRCLFLDPDIATSWQTQQRTLSQLDSLFRNTRSVYNRTTKLQDGPEPAATTIAGVKAELSTLASLIAHDREQLDPLMDNIASLDTERKDLRLRWLRTTDLLAQTTDARDHLKYQAISARFPSTATTGRYIYSKLMDNSHCLVCGTDVPSLAKVLDERVADDDCPVCGTHLTPDPTLVSPSVLSDRRFSQASEEVFALQHEVTSIKSHLDEAQTNYRVIQDQTSELIRILTEREIRQNELLKSLPSTESEGLNDIQGLGLLQRQLDQTQVARDAARDEFEAFVEYQTRSMGLGIDSVVEAFTKYAREFLLEKCTLSWAPEDIRYTQDGPEILSPAFKLDLATAGAAVPLRRNSVDDVSESQRQFLDLAFRMALITAATGAGDGAIVIDSPESSLDAVFSTRAAQVLSAFASSDGDRQVLIASNLTDSQLLPSLVRLSREEGKDFNLVNLFQIAASTAAVREYRDEYAHALDRVLSGGTLQ